MIAGRASVEWGDCLPASLANPPEGDLEGIFALYDYLGEAAAWGVLAARLGMPKGRELVESVAAFVAASPTIANAEPETGSLFSSLATGAVDDAITVAARTRPSAWARVGAAADQVLSKLGKVPLGLAAVGVGALYVTGSERVAISQIESKKTLVGETLARLSPEEARAAIKDMGLSDFSASGLLSWLPWVGGGLLLLWLASKIWGRW